MHGWLLGSHSNLGTLLVRMNRNLEALEAYDRVLELDPAHVFARHARAVIVRGMKRSES